MKRFLLLSLFCIAWIHSFDGSAPFELMYIGDADLPGVVHSSTVMQHLGSIARKPHYIGSAEHERVRTYILEELKEIGLEAEISEHSMPGEVRLGSSGGKVINVLGRLKGTRPYGKAVLLVSHYDSVLTGPGAADDGAAVAAMLVVAKKMSQLIKHKFDVPKNDIIFLFTDAEEVCLCGAKAFVEQHRWAKDIGIVLNFEARGNSGESIMFETSDGNAKLIESFADFAPSPSTNSLTYEVYKRLPNDTDLTIFKNAGYPGLNFAFIGGVRYYHSPEDTPANISLSSVAHHCKNMLAGARYFGNANLDEFKTGGPNAVYFDFANIGIIRYSETVGKVLGLVVFFLWIASLVSGISYMRFGIRQCALQIIIVAALSIFAAAMAWLLNYAFTYGFIRLAGIPKLDVLTSKSAFLALMCACCTVFIFLFHRWNPCGNWFPAAGIWLALLAPVVPFVLPGAGYLFGWPLVLLSIAQFLQFSGMREAAPGISTALSTACMIPCIVILGTTLNGVFTAMTIRMLPAEVFLALLILMPLMGQLMHSAPTDPTSEAEAASPA